MKDKNNIYKTDEIVKIDFDLFNTEELVVIYSFFSLMEKNSKHPQKPSVMLDAYKAYRNVINSIALEKAFYMEDL